MFQHQFSWTTGNIFCVELSPLYKKGCLCAQTPMAAHLSGAAAPQTVFKADRDSNSAKYLSLHFQPALRAPEPLLGPQHTQSAVLSGDRGGSLPLK